MASFDIYLVSPSPSSTRIEQLMISDPRHIPELPPWTHVPNMGITAEAGSNDVRADHDELAHDDDVDQGHRIKRRRTQSPRAERSVDMEHSTIDINPRNTVGDSQFSRLTPPTAFDNPDTGAIYLPLEDGPPLNISTPFTAKPEDMHGRSAHSPLETRTPLIRNISTFQNQESNPRSLGPRIELLEPSGRVHSNFFAPPESISAATSSSFVPHNSYTAHLRPQIARKFNSSNAAVTRPGGYEATIDEIEKWTHASVTPLVFGKKKYIKNTKSEDVIAMNLRTLKNVGNQSQIAEITAASLNPHGWRDVAIPVVSRSTHRRILLKDIFGVESIVPTYGSTAASSIGHSSRKSSISMGSTDSRLYDATPYPATRSEEMASESSNSPPRNESSRPAPDCRPQATGSASVSNDRSGTIEKVLYPLRQETISELQNQHPTRSDIPNGHVVSNDDIIGPSSPQRRTSKHALPSSPTLQRPGFVHLSPGEDVVELISPMVTELRNSAQPVDSFTFGQAFTLDANSALAMPNNLPKPAESAWTSQTEPVGILESLNPLEGFAWATEDPTNIAVHDNYPPKASPTYDYIVTLSPGNFLAANLPPIETSSTVPASPSTSAEDVSAIEEELRPHTPIPTIFDPEYSKSRPRDLWAQDQHGGLDAWVNEKTVIRKIREDLDVWYPDKESEWVEADEQEFDELDSDQGEVGYDDECIETPSICRKVGSQSPNPAKSEPRDLELSQLEEPVVDAPRGLAQQVEKWWSALHSLVKGKKRFQEQDLLDLKDALQGIYDNRRHISPTSSVADTVYTIMQMRVGDIPGEDEIGLRALARKSVRAWGSQNMNVRQER
ncbi:hypothetical protein CVT25_014090 [Psilocybe cyanescens]|uniref:Uncharacterized protein n=1 Tax=Psilocybe cyanescens TaxID=93625 RepID=A0A409VTQ0_PSICY|nr:hypothetical protein CVT25_014090 [Psilocybe cyanescens]